MNKYYKQFRRGPNAAFFIVLGCIFVGLGVLALFFMEPPLPWAISCFVFGALLGTLPLFSVFARYGIRGNTVSYRKFGMPRKADVSEIGAAVICIYDEYRRGKGFAPVTFQTENGQAHVPGIVLLKSLNEEELDLCDTRTNTRLTFRKDVITDMLLDFGFLKEFWNSDFAGRVYISEYIYALYRTVFDDVFQGSERVTVYDRSPQKIKKLKK